MVAHFKHFQRTHSNFATLAGQSIQALLLLQMKVSSREFAIANGTAMLQEAMLCVLKSEPHFLNG